MQNVVVGILETPARQFLLQRRTPSQSYAGYWEFPGGKVRRGESVADALRREIHEEVGVEVTAATPWLTRRWEYEHGWVCLHIYRARGWRGEARGAEGQTVRWASAHDEVAGLLPASKDLWKWLKLPAVMAISAAEIIGVDATLRALPAVARGDVMVQLRDKKLAAGERARLAAAIAASGCAWVANDDAALARAYGGGLHLSSARLMACSARPDFAWVGASCHSAAEIKRAADLGLDYAAVSPIKKTLTHVSAAPMGWSAFAELSAELPLYALGGMTRADLAVAQQHGAHGIAQMRQSWHPI